MGGHDVTSNLCRKPKQGEDLRDPSARDALPAGDGGLVGNLAGVELASPLDGLSERLHDARWTDAPRPSRRARLAAGWRGGVDNLVGGHPPSQGTQAALWEDWVRPKGDLNGLLAVRGRAVGRRKPVVEGDVDDPEDDLRLGPPGPALSPPGACGGGSNTVTFREVRGPDRAASLRG